LITQETKIPTRVADDPITAVARGTGIVLEDIDALREVLVWVEEGKVLK
jgi:rod shape-determining protein MreB